LPSFGRAATIGVIMSTFSYDPAELANNKIYQVRFKLGQTNQHSVVAVFDEEIQFALDSNYDDVTKACLDILNGQISKAGSLVDKETGQVSEAQSQLLKNLIALRDDLINSISRNVPKYMQWTGVFNEDKNAVDNDTEIYQDGAILDDKGTSFRLMPQTNKVTHNHVGP
jgi:hypothetical protein